MRKTLLFILSVIFGVCMIALLLCNAVLGVAGNKEAYHNENKKLNTAARTGLSEEDLHEITGVLVDYIEGAGSLDMQKQVNGENREVFNEKEKIHMVDVQNLFSMLQTLNTVLICIVLAVLLVCICFFRQFWIRFLSGVIWTCVAVLGLAAAVVVFAMLDFTSFWDAVHLVFFTNDLWMLNPSTDILIQIMPEQFFVNLAVRVAVTAVISIFVFVLAVIVIRYVLKRRSIKRPI